jgi:hypothetical protein
MPARDLLPLSLLPVLTLAASVAGAKPTPLIDASGCVGVEPACRAVAGEAARAETGLYPAALDGAFEALPARPRLLAVSGDADLDFHIGSLTADALPHRRLRGPAGGLEPATWLDWPGFGALAAESSAWRAGVAFDQDADAGPAAADEALPLALLLGLSGLVLAGLVRGLAGSG